jgi:hypothetical protein
MQSPPMDLHPFPAVKRQASLGFLSVQFSRASLAPACVEQALESVVFFEDMMRRRLTFCRLLVRNELGQKLARMQGDLRPRAWIGVTTAASEG